MRASKVWNIYRRILVDLVFETLDWILVRILDQFGILYHSVWKYRVSSICPRGRRRRNPYKSSAWGSSFEDAMWAVAWPSAAHLSIWLTDSINAHFDSNLDDCAPGFDNLWLPWVFHDQNTQRWRSISCTSSRSWYNLVSSLVIAIWELDQGSHRWQFPVSPSAQNPFLWPSNRYSRHKFECICWRTRTRYPLIALGAPTWCWSLARLLRLYQQAILGCWEAWQKRPWWRLWCFLERGLGWCVCRCKVSGDYAAGRNPQATRRSASERRRDLPPLCRRLPRTFRQCWYSQGRFWRLGQWTTAEEESVSIECHQYPQQYLWITETAP